MDEVRMSIKIYLEMEMEMKMNHERAATYKTI